MVSEFALYALALTLHHDTGDSVKKIANISYRGLHTKNNIAWASGTKGNVRRSVDGGKSWIDCSIEQAANLDIRDIEALDHNTAIALSAGPGDAGRVFRTIDGGLNWEEVARCPSRNGFWDGLAFWDSQQGLLVGDPINGRLALWRTEDGGKNWEPLNEESRPKVAPGEHCFAASGTPLSLSSNGMAWIATGGEKARVFRSENFGRTWSSHTTPIKSGKDSAGIFSIHMRNSQHGIVVGGDYLDPDNSKNNAAFTADGGKTWNLITKGNIKGYRSSVNWSNGAWRTTGTNGNEISWDDGKTWHSIGEDGHNVVNNQIFAGTKNRLGLLKTRQSIKNDKPNILFFLVDDLGWQDTSVPFAEQITSLNRRYRTPSMERLATEGIKFTQAYAASPVCSPTRTSILTGKNPARSGITNWIPGESSGDSKTQKWANPIWNQNGLDSSDETLPKILAKGGYRTAHIGKAHFGKIGTPGADPLQLGFQINVAGSHIGHPASFLPPYGDRNHSHKVPHLEDFQNTKRYLNDALTDKTLAIIDALTTPPTDHPFFIHFSHYAVHAPIEGDPSLLSHYPDNLPRAQRHYASMVESIDNSLGRILDHLETLGIADNTLIIFFSDNGGLATHAGPPTNCEPLSGGKGTMREGGTRVPLIIKWPEHIPAGKTIQTPVISDDFFPTLLAAAKIAAPEKGRDGRSMIPLMQGKTMPQRTLLWHWPHYWGWKKLRDKWDVIQPFTSLREGDWKITWRWDEQRAELFNLKNDLGEVHDLAKKFPQKRDRMVNLLSKKLQDVRAPRPRHHETLQPIPWPTTP